ncbi:hypothetical protein ACWYXN_06805 [Janthinobacterium aestuarii]
MSEIMLSKERRARVWIDDIPSSFFYPVGEINFLNNLKNKNLIFQNKMVAIELFIPVGGRFLYGMLGCETVKLKMQKLDLVVEASSNIGPKFKDALSSELESVWFGISPEYVEAIKKGAKSGIEKYGVIENCGIKFSCGAHGEIGSSEKIFERLAELCVIFLNSNGNDEEYIKDKLEIALG